MHKFDKIVCVDASPIQIDIISKIVPLEKCIIANYIVTNEEISDFFICNSSGISTVSREWINGKGRFAPGGPDYDVNFIWNRVSNIPCVTIDKLVNTYGTPDFIKIDVEGHEENV